MSSPDFKEESGGFSVIFYTEKQRSVGRKVGRRLVEGLAETQVKIMELMEADGGISKSRLAKELDISETAVDKHIKVLKDRGFIKRIGSARSGKWIVRRAF